MGRVDRECFCRNTLEGLPRLGYAKKLQLFRMKKFFVRKKGL